MNPLELEGRPIIPEHRRFLKYDDTSRLGCWSNGANYDFLRAIRYLGAIDYRVATFYVGDDQEWLDPYFFEYFKKIPNIGYTYSRKIRREACVQFKSRYRKWKRSDGAKRILREYKQGKHQRDRGNTFYDYPKGFTEHYRYLDPNSFESAKDSRRSYK